MTDEEKQPYETLLIEAKETYENQYAELMKNGFFYLEDGSKSTDEKVVEQKQVNQGY